MEIKPRKEVEVVVEGAKPNYPQLINMLIASQEMAVQEYGSLALAVYKLPNKYHNGTSETS